MVSWDTGVGALASPRTVLAVHESGGYGYLTPFRMAAQRVRRMNG